MDATSCGAQDHRSACRGQQTATSTCRTLNSVEAYMSPKGVEWFQHPSKPIYGQRNAVHRTERFLCTVLEMTNQKAPDSFILFDDLLYIFQITVGMQQDINHGLIDVADQYTTSTRDHAMAFHVFHNA